MNILIAFVIGLVSTGIIVVLSLWNAGVAAIIGTLGLSWVAYTLLKRRKAKY